MLADRIATELHDDRVLLRELRQRPAELHGVDDLLLQARLLRVGLVRGPDVDAVHLPCRDQNRQLHQPVIEPRFVA